MLANFLKNKFDKDVEKVGLQNYFISILEKSESKIQVNLNKKTEEVLKNKPVIVIANHPNEFDPVAIIASLPKRKKYFIIFTHIFTGIIRDLDRHIIPVFIQHNTRQRFPGKKFILKMLFNYEEFTPSEEHKKNLKSIKDAGGKINSGSLVIITPSGRSKKIKWYPGVGYLIKEVENNINAYIVFLHIEGTSGLDLVRFFPKSGKVLPQITLNFSDPKIIKNSSRNDAKNITKNLEKEYKNWIKSFNSR